MIRNYIICFILLSIISLIYYFKSGKAERTKALVTSLVINLLLFLYNVFIHEDITINSLIRVLITVYIVLFVVPINKNKR